MPGGVSGQEKARAEVSGCKNIEVNAVASRKHSATREQKQVEKSVQKAGKVQGRENMYKKLRTR